MQHIQLCRHEPTGQSEHYSVDTFAQECLSGLQEQVQESVVMSVGMSTCSVGISSECGIATWDGTGVFNFIVSTEAEGKSRDSMGCRTCTL